ncbi:MAG: helicase associated domain-containing protein, partial [Paraprevotella sp.]|nr:helicase associated domain-containing protein [Paraprevotella sp.]
YELLKAYVKENKHLPGKRRVENRGLLNWWKYNRKLILQGKLDKKRVQMLDELGQMRDMPRSTRLYADMFPED